VYTSKNCENLSASGTFIEPVAVVIVMEVIINEVQKLNMKVISATQKQCM